MGVILDNDDRSEAAGEAGTFGGRCGALPATGITALEWNSALQVSAASLLDDGTNGSVLPDIIGPAPQATINGTSGDDTLAGTTGNDTINGYGGNDILYGDAGNDTLNGGDGLDFLEGGAGNDTLNGGADFDFATYIVATAGVTVNLSLTTAQNTGGAGTDTISACEGLIGSDYNDTLTGDANSNIIDGGAGKDILRGGDGSDILEVSLATDIVAGETYDGGTGYDALFVVGGSDISNVTVTNIEEIDSAGTLSAKASQLNGLQYIYADTLTLTAAGVATLSGCEVDVGNFVLAVGGITLDLTASVGGGYTVDGSAGNDNITGGAGDDTISDWGGNDTLNGGDGNDTFVVGAGTDNLNGGSGIDTLNFTQATSRVTVNLGLTGAQAIGGGLGTKSLASVENIIASNYNDALIGNASDNTFFLSGGAYTIDGGAGVDTVSFEKFDGTYTTNGSIGVTVDLRGGQAATSPISNVPSVPNTVTRSLVMRPTIRSTAAA